MEGMTSDRTRKAITSLRSTLAIYQQCNTAPSSGATVSGTNR